MSDSATLARVHLRVRGDVQGVGFRYFVVDHAEALVLSGWVRNTESGEVECVAEGPRRQLEQLIEQVRRGPRGARVEGAEVMWEEPRGDLTGFRVAY